MQHRAIGRVLLHRLKRPWIVEDVEVIHDHRLLNPLPTGVVPVGEAIQHHIVAARLLEVIGLDGDALDVEGHLIAVEIEVEVEAAQHLFVADGPAEVGAEGKADEALGLGHGNSPKLVRAAGWVGRSYGRYVVMPTVQRGGRGPWRKSSEGRRRPRWCSAWRCAAKKSQGRRKSRPIHTPSIGVRGIAKTVLPVIDPANFPNCDRRGPQRSVPPYRWIAAPAPWSGSRKSAIRRCRN